MEMIDYSVFWEKSWNNEDKKELFKWLKGWCNLQSSDIEFLKRNNVRTICDAACGFGAHTVALASNGFMVSAFDVSEKAAELTREGLADLGFSDIEVKTADILNTGYADNAFDAVTAYAVLDHLTDRDARIAIKELIRIVRPDGLVLVSLDKPSDEDYECPHDILEDGSMLYTDGDGYKGMIFRPYDDNRIDSLFKEYNVVFRETDKKGNHIIGVRAN